MIRERSRGFTLLEALLAIALIGMLSGSVFGFLWTLMGSKEMLRRRGMDGQAAGAFIERVESDVACGLAGDATVGAGVRGSATSLTLLTRGVWLPTRAGEIAAGDVQGSEYVFDAGAGVLKGRRWIVGGTQTELEVISDHVQALRLRYFDGERWSDSFDSLSAGTLPAAIEVALWFGEPGATEATGGGDVAAPGTVRTRSSASAKNPGGKAGDRESAPPEAALAPVRKGPTREPDRLRVIVVPDGPVTAAKEGR